MISEADRSTKDRLGRAAYVVTGVRNLGARRVKATVEVDGTPFYKGKVSCVLATNVGKILGGTSARYSAGSRLSPRRDRTTDSSSWGW